MLQGLHGQKIHQLPCFRPKKFTNSHVSDPKNSPTPMFQTHKIHQLPCYRAFKAKKFTNSHVSDPNNSPTPMFQTQKVHQLPCFRPKKFTNSHVSDSKNSPTPMLQGLQGQKVHQLPCFRPKKFTNSHVSDPKSSPTPMFQTQKVHQLPCFRARSSRFSPRFSRRSACHQVPQALAQAAQATSRRGRFRCSAWESSRRDCDHCSACARGRSLRNPKNQWISG